jgi:hypothetical protein
MTPADFVERLAQTDFPSFASYLDDSQFSQELSNVRCQTIQLTTTAGVIGRALFHDSQTEFAGVISPHENPLRMAALKQAEQVD